MTTGALIERFTGDIEADLSRVKEEIGHNSDVQFREFRLGNPDIRAALVFVDGLTNTELVDKHIMASLMVKFPETEAVSKELMKNQILSVSVLNEADDLVESINAIFCGYTALFIDGIPVAFILCTIKEKSQNTDEPVSEALVRGPRIGFSETLNENTGLLRLQVSNRRLCIHQFQVGERAKRRLVIAYISDIANPELVEEVKRRIKKINIDDVMESGYVEQLIEDNYLSPFRKCKARNALTASAPR